MKSNTYICYKVKQRSIFEFVTPASRYWESHIQSTKRRKSLPLRHMPGPSFYPVWGTIR